MVHIKKKKIMIVCLFTFNCVVLIILLLSHTPLASPLNFFFKILTPPLATPLLKVLRREKKCKNYKIWPNNSTFHTDKDLKSKTFRGKKVYILTKDVDSLRKFEIKVKKKIGLKKA